MFKNIMLGIVVFFLFLGIFYIIEPKEEKIDTVMMELNPVIPTNSISIQKFRREYQNDDIIAVLSIDELMKQEVVVQTSDNFYYTNHNVKKEEDSNGTIFIDSNLDIHTTRKIIIHGNSSDKNIPFFLLKEYVNSYFLQEHPNITFITDTEKETYQIFSIMILENNSFFEEVNFTNEQWVEHLNSLKENSIYPIDYDAKEEDKILMLHTKQDQQDIVISAILLGIEEF